MNHKANIGLPTFMLSELPEHIARLISFLTPLTSAELLFPLLR